MNPLLETHRREMADACREFGVRRLEAFGSVLRPDFAPESDVDLLVEFEREGTGRDAFAQYFGFKEAVERLLGREVDLVVSDTLRNSAFRAEVNRMKAPLYVAA